MSISKKTQINRNYIQSISAILCNLKVSDLFMTLSRHQHEVLRVVGLGALHFLVNVMGSAIVRYLTKAGHIIIKHVLAPPYFDFLRSTVSAQAYYKT